MIERVANSVLTLGLVEKKNVFGRTLLWRASEVGHDCERAPAAAIIFTTSDEGLPPSTTKATALFQGTVKSAQYGAAAAYYSTLQSPDALICYIGSW